MRIQYLLTLHSDAEPGTGLGGDVVNDLVPRDVDGKPVLRASHIKGLVRDQLQALAALRAWPKQFVDSVLGRAGRSSDGGTEAPCTFADARVSTPDKNSPVTFLISRTALDPETGTAKDTSLRTTEAIRLGTVFRGHILLRAKPGSPPDLALRLCLLALPAVGGGRTRGSGSCVVTIEDEKRTPGMILKELDGLLKKEVS